MTHLVLNRPRQTYKSHRQRRVRAGSSSHQQESEEPLRCSSSSHSPLLLPWSRLSSHSLRSVLFYLASLMLLMPPQADVPVTVLTQDEMINWLKTTDATLTFIGNPIPGVNAPEGLVSREALDTTVTYCNKRVNSVCGGDCTVYTGGPTCLNAPDTTCLAATHDVGFCDRKG